MLLGKYLGERTKIYYKVTSKRPIKKNLTNVANIKISCLHSRLNIFYIGGC